MAGFPGATGSLVPAHNILSTDMAFHVQLPIKRWGMQMRVGPLVFNYCTASSVQLRLMTGSCFAEWRKSREQRQEFPPGSRLWVQEVFTFDFHIYSFFFPSSPLCVFLNTRPKKYLAQLVLQIHSLVSSVDCQGHISRRLGFFYFHFLPPSLQNICLFSERPKTFQPWGSFKLNGISYYSPFWWFLLSFSHARNMMPTFPQHTICELHETPLWGPDLQGSVVGKDENQQQSSKIRTSA